MTSSKTQNPTTDVSAALLAGLEAATLDHRLADLNGIPIVLTNGDQRIGIAGDVLAEINHRAPGPRRAEGVSVHHEIDSFIEHVAMFQIAGHTSIWADIDKAEIEAIYDYHRGGHESAAGWCGHRARYTMPISDQWRMWTNCAGRPMGQEAFANALDDNLEDLASGEGFPAPAAILQLARSLAIHTKGTFQRDLNPTTGEGILICKTEHTAESTKIPRAFLLGIPVFRGGPRYRVECRLAFRLAEGRPMFSYTIHREGEIKRDAFGAAVRTIKSGLPGVPAYWGSSEAARSGDK